MNRILFLEINRGCNNRCIGCAVNAQDRKRQYDIQKVYSDLIEGKKQGYEVFHPIGGEITLNSNLCGILKEARKYYTEIAISSNGRLFSYEKFARRHSKLASAFNITLCGPNQRIHESWTRTPHSYRQTIKGIKNLNRFGGKVCINIILWKEAVNHIMDYIPLIRLLKPEEIGLLALGPFGRAKGGFPNLSPSLTELSILNSFILKIKPLVKNIDIEDIPVCLFNEKILNDTRIQIQDISSSIYIGKDKRIETLGLFAVKEKKLPLNSIRLNKLSLKRLNHVISSQKTWLKPCLACGYKPLCKGIYRKYVSWKGKKMVEQEIYSLKRFHKIGQD